MNALKRSRAVRAPRPKNEAVREGIKSALETSRDRRRALAQIIERPARVRTIPAPGFEFRGTPPTLALMTTTQAKGLRVVAMMNRESQAHGSFSVGERFQVKGKSCRGRDWTIIALHNGQPTGRICTQVDAMCLQVLEENPTP